MGKVQVHQDWFEDVTVNLRTIHWMPVITQLWMNLKRGSIWFHFHFSWNFNGL
jgi:hypothetical protein